VDADAHAAAGIHRLQRHRQLGPGHAVVGSAGWLRAARAGAAATAPEQALEEIREPAARAAAGEDLLEVEVRLPALAMPEAARRRPHLVAGPVTAGAELVVGGALLRIAQRLVGLVDRLELVLGAGFLADVGVVLARQPPVGALALGLARAGFDPEGAVVILGFHARSTPTRPPSARLSDRRAGWV